MKLNKKFAVITIATLLVGGQVFASTELAGTFRNQLAEWSAKRIEIRANTTRREITESAENKTGKYTKQVQAEKEQILAELDELFKTQLEEGKSIETVLAEYQAALQEEKVIQLAKVDTEFAEVLAEMTNKVEAMVTTFEETVLAEAKQSIIADKEAKIEEIKASIKETTNVSKEELAKDIQETRDQLIQKMKDVREEVKAEVVAHFDEQMAELLEQLPELKKQCEEEMVAETKAAVESGINELISVADTVGESK